MHVVSLAYNVLMLLFRRTAAGYYGLQFTMFSGNPRSTRDVSSCFVLEVTRWFSWFAEPVWRGEALARMKGRSDETEKLFECMGNP